MVGLMAGGLMAAMLPGVVAADLPDPTCSASVSPDTLWPPNHQLGSVTATVTVTDPGAGHPNVQLVSVTSNEPDNDAGNGDGNTANDIVFVDDSTVQLRAERAATGDGRVYTLTYEVTDAAGATAQCSAQVLVPHDQ